MRGSGALSKRAYVDYNDDDDDDNDDDDDDDDDDVAHVRGG